MSKNNFVIVIQISSTHADVHLGALWTSETSAAFEA